MRFRPPPIDLDPDLRWVLLRAFGPTDASPPPPASPAGAVETAEHLDLGARIATRIPAGRLDAEVGRDATRRLIASALAAEAGRRARLAAVRHVAAVAAAAGIPLAFLKGAALDLTGVVEHGARNASDLDVLVPPRDALRLQALLRRRGAREIAVHASPHQLRPLALPSGLLVEVHRHVPGLTPPRRARFARHADLARPGLLQLVALPPTAGAPREEVQVPAPWVLSAHALVHGIAEHGFSPDAYPAFRMVADLIDLGPLEGPAREAVLAWTSPALPAGEAEDALGLVERLRSGRVPGARTPLADEGPERLLAHLVAARTDPAYERSLRLEAFVPRLVEGPAAAAWGRAIWQALFPTSEQMERIYGPSRGRVHGVARRVWRPLDLVRRAALARAHRRRSRRRTGPGTPAGGARVTDPG